MRILTYCRMALALASIGTLVACGYDAKAPSKQNFTVAINSVIAQYPTLNPACTKPIKAPIAVPIDSARAHQDEAVQPYVKSRYDALVEAGLFDATAYRLHPLAFASTQPPVTVIRYAARPRNEVIPISDDPSGPQIYKVCYASIAVDRIEGWLEPQNFMGYDYTTVAYRMRIIAIAPWTNLPGVRKAFPDIERTIATLQNHVFHTSLVYRDKGWTIGEPDLVQTRPNAKS